MKSDATMKYAVLVAGGTGGHINSALTLGEKFEELGFHIEYISGRRFLDFKLYSGKDCKHIFSYPLVGKGPLNITKSLFFNTISFFIMIFNFLIKRPKFVFGAGGYVCAPPLLAAFILRIPVFILEQNSIMGLTNKLLSHFSKIIFTNFDSVQGLKKTKRVKNYGNPLRKEFFEGHPILKKANTFYILAMGGSLGSQEINELLTDLIKSYDLDIDLSITHQIGRNDVPTPPSHTRISYRQVEYLDHIASEYQRADFIICRGGAMTISELKFVQKPALIIPILYHKDQHQLHNAKSLKLETHFPVYVELPSNLSKEKCKKFQFFIKTEYLKQKSKKENKIECSNRKENPSSLISEDILKNV